MTQGFTTNVPIDTDPTMGSGLDYVVPSQGAVKTAITTKVPTARTLTTTAPITINGGASADLSADRTIAIIPATTSVPGSMSAADKTKLDGLSSTVIYPPNYRFGCVLSNSAGDLTNDIDITAGNWRDSTNAVNMDGTAMTKRLDADWGAGTNQGMRNKGAAITDTTYHIYLVTKAAGANPDYYAHTSLAVATVITSLQAETGGSAYVYARRIGSIMRESGAIARFVQHDNYFERQASYDVQLAANQVNTAILYTLKIPYGITVTANVILSIYDSTCTTANYTLLSSPSLADVTPDGSHYSVWTAAIVSGGKSANFVACWVGSNTASQIRSRIEAQIADVYESIVTIGWLDDNL